MRISDWSSDVCSSDLADDEVRRHLAGERCADLFHLRLDDGVAGLPHQRPAAGSGNAVEQRLAALHVADDGGAGVPLQHVTRQEQQDLIAPEDASLRIDEAEAVAVAVRSEEHTYERQSLMRNP